MTQNDGLQPLGEIERGQRNERTDLYPPAHNGLFFGLSPSWPIDSRRFSSLRLLDKRMQRLDRILPLLNSNKQTDRMRRQHILVRDNPVLSKNLQRAERQLR